MARSQGDGVVTALIKQRWSELGMDHHRFCKLTGLKRVRVTKLLNGSAFMRAEWIEVISSALQLDRIELTLLLIEQNLDADTARFIRENMPPPISEAERQWLLKIREASRKKVPAPTAMQRRVIEALLKR
jgi:cyanate lyase